MIATHVLRWIALITVAAPLAITGAVTPRAQTNDELAVLRTDVRRLYSQGKYADAMPLAERYVALAAQRRGEDHPEYVIAISQLADLYHAQGRYAEAEPLYKTSLTITEKALGRDHPAVGVSIDNLATLDVAQGHYAEAEPLYKRSLVIFEKALGPDHLSVGKSLNSLAELYRAQSRYAEAEPLYQRSLAITEKALGPDHLSVGAILNNLAALYRPQVRYAEAEPLYKRSLAIAVKALDPNHPTVATSLNNLAALYGAQGRYAEAEPLYQRSLAIREKVLGPDHPDVGQSLNNLAELYRAQARYAEAEPFYKRSLAIWEKALGLDHAQVGTLLNNLAVLYFVQRDWKRATDFWRRSTGVIVSRARRGTLAAGQALAGKQKIEAEQLSYRFWGLVKVAYRAWNQHSSNPELKAEMFQTAQWAHSSEAAQSLQQMAARGAKGDPRLSVLVRERQDLVTEWQQRDAVRSTAVAQAPEKRNAQAEAQNVARLAAIDTRIAEIDKRLQTEFPDYAALVSPTPMSIEDVQTQLGSDEALVLILDTPNWNPTPEETFLFVVTKTDARWVRSGVGTQSLRREVAALRCGLDYDGAWRVTGSPCPELLKVTYTPTDHLLSNPLPFDGMRAYALYKALFGEVEDLIKGKDLLIVPSGALNALPLQVLVTEKPSDMLPSTNAGYAKIAWLGTRNALTVLPAVSSLKALRADAKAHRAADTYIGFGNPLLTGPDGTDKRAWDYQRCQQPEQNKRARVAQDLRAPALAPLFKGGLADVDGLRRQYPLPETADELCTVARARGMSDPDRVVNLGARATEARVKAQSIDGTLAHAGVVHFATHGLVAGETALFADNHAEPALLLTPPETASEEDDGLLRASEVTTLKLDADWVILSACNTAAGDSVGGDALSGLARAFFYAGARALLVSHWYVDSDVTVALITKSFDALKTDPKIGRAEALRRAISALIAGGRTAHPSAWAPFVVVGEGGSGR